MADSNLAPIIIKKIKKGGHGHHGGAWKVAYADFVTAMMAFFLLLWLLSSTTKEQREGIAEYFTPTIGLKDALGIGFEGGATPNQEGTSKNTLTTPGLVAGQVQQGPKPTDPAPVQDMTSASEPETGATPLKSGGEEQEQANEEIMKQAEQALLDTFEQAELEQYKKNLIITNTPEGLKIDVVDDQDKPMFLPGTAIMTDSGRQVLQAISGVIVNTPNKVALTGHTETVAYPPGSTYTGWELSADRANASRRFLSENVLEPERVQKVVGMADHELLMPEEPQSPRNRRITVLLLRNALMANVSAPATRGLLTVPKLDKEALQPPKKEEPKPEPPIEVKSPAIFAPQQPQGGEGEAIPGGGAVFDPAATAPQR